MLAILAAVAVAYNPPGVTDQFLRDLNIAFGSSPPCVVQCVTDECWGLKANDKLVDAIITDVAQDTNRTDATTTRRITFQPTLQDAMNDTDPTRTRTAMQVFGKTANCDLPLEHVAFSSVSINATNTQAGSVRARFQLPVFLALASSFGARADNKTDPDTYIIDVLAALVVNTSIAAQPYMNPMPPVTDCDTNTYICDPGLCTLIDINYQNFFEPDEPQVLQLLNETGAFSFSQTTVQNRFYGLSFCGPVFSSSTRAIADNSVSPATKIDQKYFPTDVKVSFPPNDRRDPFAGLRVSHGHSLEVLYPAWAPLGCNLTNTDDPYCQLQPPIRYGGMPFRQQRITNNLPLYTTFYEKEDRLLCPIDQDDLDLGFLVYNTSGVDGGLLLADICIQGGISVDFFVHCCKNITVNYVYTGTITTGLGLKYEAIPHTDFSQPVKFEPAEETPNWSYYDNIHTVIGWHDTLLPCCPWWSNITEHPPDETAYKGAETCIQNVTEVFEYAQKNPAWVAACRTDTVKTHRVDDWVDLLKGNDANRFYDKTTGPIKISVGDELSSTFMPIVVNENVPHVGSLCTFDDTAVISKKKTGAYSGLFANGSTCDGDVVYRKVLIVNAHQGNDANTVVKNPEQKVQAVIMMQPHDCLENSTAWLTCGQSLGRDSEYKYIHTWAVYSPITDEYTPAVGFASGVQPCNGIEIGFTPTLMPAYTGHAKHDMLKLKRNASDLEAVAYVDPDILQQGPFAQAAMLMYGLEPNAARLEHLKDISNCNMRFYNVNPFDAKKLWVGDGRFEAGEVLDQTSFCAAATLTQKSTTTREYEFSDAACSGATDAAAAGGDQQKVAVGSVKTVDEQAAAPGLLKSDESTIVPQHGQSGASTNCDGPNAADIVSTYAYDIYSTNMFYCKPGFYETKSGFETLDNQLGLVSCNTAYTIPSDNFGFADTYLSGFPLSSSEALGREKPSTLSDPTGTTSMNARFSCKVTNEVGLMPELLYKPLENAQIPCLSSASNAVCDQPWNAKPGVQPPMAPLIRRDPYSVYTGFVLNASSISISVAGKMQTITPQATMPGDSPTWTSGRYKAVQKGCGTASSLGDRPVWHKGCLLSSSQSDVPPVPGTESLMTTLFPKGSYENQIFNDRDAFFTSKNGNVQTQFTVTPSWYPRARQFNGDYDSEAVNPKPVTDAPFRYVLDSLEFFGVAPLDLISMLAPEPDEDLANLLPNNGLFLKAPTPVQKPGVGPAFVPADYSGRPYVPSSESTCVCDRELAWQCITLGPDNWADKQEFPDMHEACSGRGSGPPLTNSSAKYLPPTCTAQLRKCGWSWRIDGGTMPLGGVSGDIGLYIYGNRHGPIPILERDPLAKPATANQDFKNIFMDLWGPLPNVMKNLQDESTATGYYTVPGPCVRSPFGKISTRAMTADDVANSFIQHPYKPSTDRASPYEVGTEALIGYCETFNGKYQYCSGDRRDLDGRTSFCATTPHVNDIVMGWTISSRTHRCIVGKETAACVYFAHEPQVDTLQELVVGVPKNLDVTVIVAPMAWSVVTAIESGMFLYDIRQTSGHKLHNFETGMFTANNDAFKPVPSCTGAATKPAACRQQATAAELLLIQDVGAALAGTPETEWVDHIKQTLTGLYTKFDHPPFNSPEWNSDVLGSSGENCPDGQVLVPSIVTSVDSNRMFAQCAPDTFMMTAIVGRGHRIDVPGMTLTTATGDPLIMPATATPSCNGLIIAAPRVTVDVPLVIDQTKCKDTEATMMGVVIVGPDARNTTIAGVELTNPPGKHPVAVAALGYDNVYGTKQVVNVTGLVANVTTIDEDAFQFAFAHAVAAVPVEIAVNGSAAPHVLLQEAQNEHFAVDDYWNLFNVTEFTSVFGWGFESKLYHANTRAEHTAAVAVAVGILIGFVLLLLNVVAFMVEKDLDKKRPTPRR